MKHNWSELYMYWNYCTCSDRLENGTYNPLKHKFLLKKKPIKVIKMVKANDIGYASLENSRLVINFNGTDDRKDWRNNLKTMRNDRRDVHTGFYETALKFREEIDRIIDMYLDYNPNPSIVLCGHSRGGAIAKEIARYIAKYRKLKVRLFVYGAPRIGGDEWLEEFLSLPIEYYDVINGGDIVPNIPPKAFGFEDLPNQIQLRRKFWHYFPWMIKRVHLQYGKVLRKKIK